MGRKQKRERETSKQGNKPKWSMKSGGIDLQYLRPLLATLDLHTLEQLRKETSFHIANKKSNKRANISELEGSKKDYCSSKFSYLSVIEDDWSDLFIGSDDGIDDYYVYIHIDPRKGNGVKLMRFTYESIGAVVLNVPVYVGMGRGSRCDCFKRTEQHQNLLRKLVDDGYAKGEIVQIVKGGLSKSQALELESKLILYFGCMCKTKKRSLSGMLPCLYNHRYEPYPNKYNALTSIAHSEFNIIKGGE